MDQDGTLDRRSVRSIDSSAPKVRDPLAQAIGLGAWTIQRSGGLKGRDTGVIGGDWVIDANQRIPVNISTMPQSFARVLIHLVFSTKNRERFLTTDIQSELHPYLAGVLDHIDCPCLRVGGVEDHVHLFFGISRTRTVAEVVEIVKTSSSKWIKTKGSGFAGFHWQSGYGAFSVSQSDAETVIAYVREQAKHHRKMTFQEEYRKLLDRYQVDYDERYVWD